MEHLVAHAVPGHLLFASHEEAAELWACVLALGAVVLSEWLGLDGPAITALKEKEAIG